MRNRPIQMRLILALSLLGPAALVFAGAPGSQPASMSTNDDQPYLMNKPDAVDPLPAVLQEASGLTDLSATQVALVQDEKGVVFVYDLPAKKVVRQIPFGPPGDYEGMTRVKDTVYVLESGGVLYKIQGWDRKTAVSQTKLDLPTKDNEGLCYDPIQSALIISPKSKWRKGKTFKDERPLFVVDLGSGKLNPKPMVVLDMNQVSSFAKKHGLNLPSKMNKKGMVKERLKFRPASVAVHPKTGEIYVLSAVDKTLVAFSRSGEVRQYWKLDDSLFYKPEGMTFLPDSTLLIANEGKKSKPNIMTFKMR